jgi:hypothetical protein
LIAAEHEQAFSKYRWVDSIVMRSLCPLRDEFNSGYRIGNKFTNSDTAQINRNRLAIGLPTIEHDKIFFKICRTTSSNSSFWNISRFASMKKILIHSLDSDVSTNDVLDWIFFFKEKFEIVRKNGKFRSPELEVEISIDNFQVNYPDNLDMDEITKCKDCEFKHICTDCRAYLENPDDQYSAPLKCGYDPYTCEWEEWSTNPLKQKAIEFYGMQELVAKGKSEM